CLTDQNCPQSAFCLDQKCVADVCLAGETRCWGKPNPNTHVAVCKVNGGGWVPSPCAAGNYCDDGKCVPWLCQPGATNCSGAKVLRCVDGIEKEALEDCASNGLVCQAGKCVDDSCAPGQIKCAGESTALICKQKAGKWRFEVVDCKDPDSCTWDRCVPTKGCQNTAKPNGIACSKGNWCYEGQCAAVKNNLVVMFDTSGSMKFQVPGKICYDQEWPDCNGPQKSCNRMGVSKNVFRKAFVHVDQERTRLALFRFPQLWISPKRTTSPKAPYWKPPVSCGNGNYVGYFSMTDHGAAESVDEGSNWYWQHLDEVLCVPFPVTETQDQKTAVLKWMDGEEEFGSDPELRASGGTPIGRTLFYLGEYLRNRVVVDGKKCSAKSDCGNPDYLCDNGVCKDPMRACRQTSVVVFTDGGEENFADKLFSPWVQAKRLAYGLGCSADIDCVGGARCLCPPGQNNCTAQQRECLPENLQTGYYCRSTMQPCLPEAASNDPAYCPKAGGVVDCVKDPVTGVAVKTKQMQDNVLRSPNGEPFGVKLIVVDISGDKDALERTGNLARAAGGLLLASDDADEDGFLLNLRKAFDVASKPACGLKSVGCFTPAGGGAPCDDGNPCTNDACNVNTGTCTFVPNTGACEDGDKCTLSERCLFGKCVSGIAQVNNVAGNGLSKSQEGNASNVGMSGPRDVAIGPDKKLYALDAHRVVRVNLQTGKLETWLGSEDAGNADGKGKEARFVAPQGMEFASDGRLVIADTGTHRIRAAYPGGDVVTIAGSSQGFVDGAAAVARFKDPTDIAIDTQQRIWVADSGNHRLRRISVGGQVSTVLGTGVPQSTDGLIGSALTAYPQRISQGPMGTMIFAERYRVRVISVQVQAQQVQVTTLAGSTPGFVNATGAAARFNVISGIAPDQAGGVWVSDRNNQRLRYVSPQGRVTTQAGNSKPGFKDGFGSSARFWHPEGLGWSKDWRLWVADFDNRRVRVVDIPALACPDGGVCNPGSCDPKTGQCVSKPKKDGSACDTDLCIAAQTCQSKLCAGGTPVDCDDGQSCTADSCDADKGGCLYVATKEACDDGSPCTTDDACLQGYCRGNPKDCNDGDPNTLDLCEAGTCLHRQTQACATDADCADGEAVCTKDMCVNSECVYEATGAQGCCVPELLFVDFNNGSTKPLTIINAKAETGWALSQTDSAETGKVSALRYGDKTSDGFSGPSQGQVLVPKLLLPSGRKFELSMRLWIDVERATLFDELQIVATVYGKTQVLWSKGPTTSQAVWLPVELDLTDFSGSQVEISIHFDTVDHKYNEGQGVSVDDLSVEVRCD
ncbi:MAG TPA: hypothetical protein DCQ06_04475, partial [Myxococcales bacterium]|nr:hypothetical protein [Myxococcales bacterium]